MFGKPKILLLILLALTGLSTACERIYEDLAPCEVYLEFRFEYNMEFEDRFDPLVGSVDVFFFDSDDKLLFVRRATASQLIGGNRMALTDMLEYGKYKVLTIGDLSDNFRVSDHAGLDLVPGQTTLDDVIFGLERESDRVDTEFPHLYFGEAIEVDYSRTLTAHTVIPVYLIRDTNKFVIRLEKTDGDPSGTPAATPYYTFEITTPEGAVYDWNNEPVEPGSPVTYLPYGLTPGDEPKYSAVGYLNTCRLFDRSGYDYKLTVRETGSGEQVWSYDLMKLLEATQPDYPLIPFSEYLDRRGEWELILYYRGGEGDAFIAFKIQVNGWIVWFSDFGT